MFSPVFGVASVMNAPDLQALQRGEPEAWDEAFRWLWPTAFAVAQLKLQPFLPQDVEDVAIEALEALVEKVPEVRSVEELKPLVASIAHHKAVSRLRGAFSQKRGSGQTVPLEAQGDEGGDCPEVGTPDSPLDSLDQKELAERVSKTLAALKPPLGEILSDFFLEELRYEEIAKKHGIAVGSVGVYLKRGLEAMGGIWGKND